MDDAILSRLQEAVDSAGGQASVAKAAGIPSSTLHDYLKGTEARFTRMISLARACKVSLDWLATGEKADWLSDIPMFRPEILSSRAHLSGLVMLLSSAEEYHRKMNLKPTLLEIFRWIGPHYLNAMALPDILFEVAPLGEKQNER